MLRNSNRLYTFYTEIRRIHMAYVPEWRFSQLMYNVFGNEDIFYLEEEDVLKRLKNFFGEE